MTPLLAGMSPGAPGGSGLGPAPGAALAQGASLPAGAQGPGLPQSPGGKGVPLPHDIRAAMPYHIVWWQLLLLILVAALLVFAAMSLRRWWLRRRAARPAPERDPWDVLTERLSPPPSSNFGTKAQEDFFFTLSLVLREAIERRSGIAATDLTWQELRQPLRQRLPLTKATVESILTLLERADYVKFGGAPSSIDEAAAASAAVRQWVSELRPGPQAAGQITGLPWQEPGVGSAHGATGAPRLTGNLAAGTPAAAVSVSAPVAPLTAASVAAPVSPRGVDGTPASPEQDKRPGGPHASS